MILEIKDMVMQEEGDTQWEVSLDIPSVKVEDAGFQVNVLVGGNTVALVDLRVDDNGLVQLRARKWASSLGQWVTSVEVELANSQYIDGEGK